MSTQTYAATARGNQPVRILFASFAGTTLEFYDFFIYGTMAALVFKQLFFPGYSELSGTLAAFATFAVGFVARPLGSVLFGYWGDKLGRRTTLILSLAMMGGSTVGIGLVPSFESIGVFAPILLTALRVMQGLALGGEWGGAALMLVENAPPGRKGVMGSVVQMGAPGGLILATGITSLSVMLSGDQFLVWGWRLPFVASLVLLGVAYWIRHGIDESPEFQEMRQSAKALPRAPISTVLRENWKDLIKAFGMAAPGNAVFFIVSTYTLSYATSRLGMDRAALLNVLMLAAAIYLFTIPMFGWLADKTSPAAVIAFGCAATIAFSYFYFVLLNAATVMSTFLAMVVALALIHAAIQAPQAALFASRYDVSVRYTGVALSQAIPTTIVGGTVPFLATLFFAWTGNTTLISAYVAILGAAGLLCALLSRHREGAADNGTLKATVARYPTVKA